MTEAVGELETHTRPAKLIIQCVLLNTRESKGSRCGILAGLPGAVYVQGRPSSPPFGLVFHAFSFSLWPGKKHV